MKVVVVISNLPNSDTKPDQLLAAEWDRVDARARVRFDVDEVLRSWQGR